MADALILLRRRRRDVGHFKCMPRTQVRTGGNQREWRAGVRPADRVCKQPHNPAVLQDLVGKGVHRRFGVSDDHHTLPPLLFLALAPLLGPLLCSLLSSHDALILRCENDIPEVGSFAPFRYEPR